MWICNHAFKIQQHDRKEKKKTIGKRLTTNKEAQECNATAIGWSWPRQKLINTLLDKGRSRRQSVSMEYQ